MEVKRIVFLVLCILSIACKQQKQDGFKNQEKNTFQKLNCNSNEFKNDLACKNIRIKYCHEALIFSILQGNKIVSFDFQDYFEGGEIQLFKLENDYLILLEADDYYTSSFTVFLFSKEEMYFITSFSLDQPNVEDVGVKEEIFKTILNEETLEIYGFLDEELEFNEKFNINQLLKITKKEDKGCLFAENLLKLEQNGKLKVSDNWQGHYRYLTDEGHTAGGSWTGVYHDFYISKDSVICRQEGYMAYNKIWYLAQENKDTLELYRYKELNSGTFYKQVKKSLLYWNKGSLYLKEGKEHIKLEKRGDKN
ncbi:MAG: DUF5991 domain-containing protein [Flavobacteriaceae bacterium]|nr:DUF5991 domain-containing protein [Flavobacteriaceae bacterium]